MLPFPFVPHSVRARARCTIRPPSKKQVPKQGGIHPSLVRRRLCHLCQHGTTTEVHPCPGAKACQRRSCRNAPVTIVGTYLFYVGRDKSTDPKFRPQITSDTKGDTKYRSKRTSGHGDDVAARDEPPLAKATRARVLVGTTAVRGEDECYDVVVAAAVVGEHHVPTVTSSGDAAPIAGHARGRHTGWE